MKRKHNSHVLAYYDKNIEFYENENTNLSFGKKVYTFFGDGRSFFCLACAISWFNYGALNLKPIVESDLGLKYSDSGSAEKIIDDYRKGSQNTRILEDILGQVENLLDKKIKIKSYLVSEVKQDINQIKKSAYDISSEKVNINLDNIQENLDSLALQAVQKFFYSVFLPMMFGLFFFKGKFFIL